jgi:hypothetical protein
MFQADYPEAMRKCNSKETTQAKRPCPRCLCPNTELYNTQINFYDKRNPQEDTKMRRQYLENRRDGNPELLKEADDDLKVHSLHPRFHPRFPGFHPYYNQKYEISDDDKEFGFGLNPLGATGYEAMHAFEHGVLKNIPEFTMKLIRNKNGVADDILRDPYSKEVASRRSANMEKVIHTRIKSFKSARMNEEGTSYLPTFGEGSKAGAWLRAVDNRYLAQMYMLAINDGLDFFKLEFATKYTKLMNATFKIGHYIFAGEDDFDLDKLNDLQETIHGYGHLYREVFGRVSDSGKTALYT